MGGPALPPLLDTYTGAAAAYSLRKLKSDYTGKVLQVRRASDHVEVDVGFDSNGLLSLDSPVTNVTEESTGITQGSSTNAAKLGEFCGEARRGGGDTSYATVDSMTEAAHVEVVTWYDQSGNTINVTQTAANGQPRIYDRSSGLIVEANGKPAIKFDGSSSVLKNTNGWTQGSSRNDFTVLSSDGTASGVWNTDFNPRFSQNLRCDSMKFTTLGFTSSNGVVSVSEPNASTINTSYLVTAEYDLTNTALSLYKNGSLEVTTSMVNQRTGTGGDVSIGTAYHDTDGDFGGKIQEIVSYQTRKADIRADIETNINTFYSIY
jgi:hypothetical protein